MTHEGIEFKYYKNKEKDFISLKNISLMRDVGVRQGRMPYFSKSASEEKNQVSINIILNLFVGSKSKNMLLFPFIFLRNIYMGLPRKKFREVVFQMLYSHNYQVMNDSEFVPFMMNILKTTKKNVKEACEKIVKIDQELSKIDEIIKNDAIDYKIERISKVELNVLRLGLFELLFDEEIPSKVAISEALRLCQKFGNIDSTKFINAILDSEYKKMSD